MTAGYIDKVMPVSKHQTMKAYTLQSRRNPYILRAQHYMKVSAADMNQTTEFATQELGVTQYLSRLPLLCSSDYSNRNIQWWEEANLFP